MDSLRYKIERRGREEGGIREGKMNWENVLEGLGDRRGEMERSGYNQISCTHFLNSQRINKILPLKVKKEKEKKLKKEISLFFLKR